MMITLAMTPNQTEQQMLDLRYDLTTEITTQPKKRHVTFSPGTMSRNESRDLRAAMYLLFDKTQTRMSSFEVVNVIQTSGQTDLAGFRRRFETFFLGETGTREFNEAVAIVYSHHSRSPEETIAVLSSMVFNNLPVCAKEEDNSAVVSDITERYLNIPIGGSSGVPGCESALLT